MSKEKLVEERILEVFITVIDGFVLVVFCVAVLFWAGVFTGGI